MQTFFKIAIGIARGLEYLHRLCAMEIVHLDVKPHNVLLDEDFTPKISDFGLAKSSLREHNSTVTLSCGRGTIGYIAPEVVCRYLGSVSHKSDVYSYGMMVLEIVGGRRNVDNEVDNSSQIYMPHWIYNQIETNQDVNFLGIGNDEDEELARKMIIVSFWCIQTDPSSRPTMTRVVEMLESKVEVLQIPPRPYLFSAD
ncbi:hypothetical protein LIER_35002 [Lithospermum erythrorhizon]|uniref:Protein kinase domain-containing protein n=1 Tax=Lithospermum erythrorhizon TaxID=34254 RepID=A0AAV3NJD8_LITER